MLKWLRSIAWRPTLPHALVIVAGLSLAAILASHQPHNEKNNDASACATHECYEDAAADDLAFYTEILAVFTGLLAVVSAGQGYFLWRADRASKLAADRAERATRESMELATKQFLLEGRRADTAEKEHGLLRLQFIALNRPIIEIRSVGVAASGTGGRLFQPGFPIKGSLVVRNAGGSDARILHTEYRFFVSAGGLPMVPPLEEQANGATKPLLYDLPQIISAHGSCLVQIESGELVGGAEFIDTHNQLRWRVWIMGAIRYSDIGDTERWMGFCREYVPAEPGRGEGSFIPIKSPDYEYQD